MTTPLSPEQRRHLMEILKVRFHLDVLHPFQADVIARLLQGQSVLAVVATGAGKSLCYQLPSLFWNEGVLVVSPLVALMHHQSEKMGALGISSQAFTGQISPGQKAAILGEWLENKLPLLYVAPERLGDTRLKETLKQKPPRLLVVDEAHCISEWGYDFRPDYRRIRLFREFVGHPPVLALTATATERVKADIRWQLTRDEEPFALVEGGVDRPNLYLSVEMVEGRSDYLRRVASLAGVRDGGVIIYCGTRKRVEYVAKYLETALKEPVRPYHAGMTPERRRLVERAFGSGALRVVAATTAFGMGIDRGDIRRVIHVAIPSSLDAYYQEIGRGGRDGKPAQAIMLIQPLDLYRRERWINNDEPDPHKIQEIMERVALQKASRWVIWELEDQDTRTSQALSVLQDRGFVSLAPASQGMRVCREKSGVLEETEAVVYRLRHFWRQRLALFDEMARYVQSLECRRGVLLRYYGQPVSPIKPCCDRCAASPHRESEAIPRADGALVDQLREWRRQQSERLLVAPYIILSDRDLWGIAVKRPPSLEALAQCRGMGPKRLQKYGAALLTLIQGYDQSQSNDLPRVDPASARDRAVWHFEAGTPWSQVLQEVGRSESTIRGYLTSWIETAPESEWAHYVGQWIAGHEYAIMAELMQELGTERLRPLFEAAAGRYTYEQWSVARAVFCRRKSLGIATS